MLIPFNDLPDNARIWIYQCNRTFTTAEITQIKVALDQFLQQWTAHGNDLSASYHLPYQRFIVIGLDQSMTNASGCSIDASVHFIQGLEKQFQVSLLDNMNVSYKQGEYIAYKPLIDFKKMAKQKAVSKKTIVFNNLVATKAEFLEHWEVPAEFSWHARFM